MSEPGDREFRNITAKVDALLAEPSLQDELAEKLAAMRSADRAYRAGRAPRPEEDA